ncbi:MAG: hypothetical protein O8C61_10270 [Candidatus Methanoperedens sp.]|nr:hypothetical protein [Candidatus Methanoperedens sp.]
MKHEFAGCLGSRLEGRWGKERKWMPVYKMRYAGSIGGIDVFLHVFAILIVFKTEIVSILGRELK